MNYAYANGRIKAVETTILDKNKLSKLLKVNKNEFLRTLIDLGYGNSNSKNLEELISEELLEVKKLLDEISPQKKYTDLFFLSNDALNIKAFYKMRIFNVSHHDIFVDTGTITKEQLKLAVFDEDYSLLSKDNKDLLMKINYNVENLNNPRLISAIIDNTIFQFILERANNEALKKYFKSYIDFVNVLTFIRSKRLNWRFDEFKKMYLENGEISLYKFEEAYELSNDAIIKTFNIYYNGKLSKGLRAFYENNDLSSLERYFDKLLLELMSEFQYDTFGIGPIIYYFLKKQSEAKNIRLIYASNDIDLSDLLVY